MLVGRSCNTGQLLLFGTVSCGKLNGNHAQYEQSQSQCAAQYNKLTTHPAVPPFQVEDWYEGEHSMTELQLREEAYWEVLSGCYLGRFFRNDAIWTMSGPKSDNGSRHE
jgi:hypothetical protein